MSCYPGCLENGTFLLSSTPLARKKVEHTINMWKRADSSVHTLVLFQMLETLLS